MQAFKDLVNGLLAVATVLAIIATGAGLIWLAKLFPIPAIAFAALAFCWFMGVWNRVIGKAEIWK